MFTELSKLSSPLNNLYQTQYTIPEKNMESLAKSFDMIDIYNQNNLPFWFQQNTTEADSEIDDSNENKEKENE